MVANNRWQLALRAVAATGAVVSVATAALIANNLRTTPSVTPTRDVSPHRPRSRVSVLVPARNEQATIGDCLRSLVNQAGVDELLVLDDDSTDATSEISEAVLKTANTSPNAIPTAQLLRSTQQVKQGWLGKPWACQRLAEAASGDVLIFIDADVRLAPGAIAGSVALMREYHLDMLCPYPQQLVPTPLTRLVQPLLQWSWMAMIPAGISMRLQPPSMAVGNGQFAVFDAAAYWAIGGHRAVADDVLEDVGIARVLRREGFRTAVVDGSQVATCQMYTSDRELVDGYSKSLWRAFGSGPTSTTAVTGFLVMCFALPPVIAVTSRDRVSATFAATAYTAAVAGRVLVAKRTGQRVIPDSLAHPLSIIAFAGLTAVSIRRRRRGALTWKGRPLPT